MADLIIKPATGTGNKLIVKDMAGGAVLTTADSGATIANIDSVTAASVKLTPGSAPGSPTEGQLYYNNADNIVAVYNGTSWDQLSNIPLTATGGTITTSGIYTIHTFTSSGTFTPSTSGSVDVLVVAGGGGGGGGAGGLDGGAGGGAGGLLTSTLTVSAQAYSITVGAGGAGGAFNVSGVTGSNSVALGITSLGGGYGTKPNVNGGNGGSGGGAGGGGAINSGGLGTAGQGYDGGDKDDTRAAWGLSGSGGGGAGGAGGDWTGTPSANDNRGGTGVDNSYSGSFVGYAGGGGGGSGTGGSTQGTAGTASHGGGAGGLSAHGSDATTNRGGGGGGGGSGSTYTGGNGSSGIVIIRYLT